MLGFYVRFLLIISLNNWVLIMGKIWEYVHHTKLLYLQALEGKQNVFDLTVAILEM